MRTTKLLVLALAVFALAGATMTLAQYIEIVRDPPEPSSSAAPQLLRAGSVSNLEGMCALEGAVERLLNQILGSHSDNPKQLVGIALQHAVQIADVTRVEGCLRAALELWTCAAIRHFSEQLGVGLGRPVQLG